MSNNSLNVADSPCIDVLSDVLHAIRLHASSYYCVEFAAPWGIDEPQSECGVFHIVIEGSAWLTMPDPQSPIMLSVGDIVAFPTGSPHQISDSADSPLKSGADVLDNIRQKNNPFAGETAITTLLCGYFQYKKQTALPLLRDMPPFLHIRSREEPGLVWLNHLANTLAHESRSFNPGGAMVVDRLTEVLVIQMLRWHINNQHNDRSYFRALSDERLNRALSLIHKQPSFPWTVESIGRRVGMSRSAFANHFHDIVGMTPLAYLSQWRMHIAYELLTESDESMSDIAEQVGYKSEASFGKAFKKIMGDSPGKVRKKATES